MTLYKKITSWLVSVALSASTVLPYTSMVFIGSLSAFSSTPAHALLRTAPVWYDTNGANVAPDWHYRVPITVPASTSVNSTVKVDVNFATLATALGITGTFDINSPRVVRSNNTLATIQEYTPGIFGGATNTTANRGEVRFIAEDAGAATYYLYFDITENGAKPANPQTPIDGNFERGSTGQAQPPGWNAPTKSANYDAQVRPSENPSISTDGTTTGNGNSPRTVAGTPNTGSFSYLLGARTNNEGASAFPSSVLTKTITVPSSNPGNLVFRYRIQGWDSNVNGNTTQYDYFGVQIVGSTTTNVVGPALNNYTTYPFSPNYGTNQAGLLNSGYGQYNGWDFNTLNGHATQNGNAAMNSFTRGSEPWFTVTQSLAPYAGQTVTLRFSMSNTVLYKTWAHIDDVEWSVVAGTLGNPQGFGVAVVGPSTATPAVSGSPIIIQAQVDASPETFLTADIIDPSGTVVASGIRLYNNGTHGSNAATPQFWYNNGTDAANPTYTLPAATPSANNWVIRVYARDASNSTIGATDGSIHIPGAATPQIEANYFNIDDATFPVRGSPTINMVKSSVLLSDPINGTTNPKNIPGAAILYSLLITNTGGGSPDTNTVVITDPIPPNTKLYVGDLDATGSGPVRFANGTNSSGLTYTFAGFGASATNVSFSNNNGSTYGYTPSADPQGYDTNITHIRISPQGILNANPSAAPNFTLSFQIMVE